MPVLELVMVRLTDPRTQVLLAGLSREYVNRYGGDTELRRLTAVEFDPPDGAFRLLLDDGLPIAGGGYRRYDEATAELKHVWTSSWRRREGFGLRIVGELERAAAAARYRRVLLATGPQQPEARGLYLAAGYTPVFDSRAEAAQADRLVLGKELASGRSRQRDTVPAATRSDDRDMCHAR